MMEQCVPDWRFGEVRWLQRKPKDIFEEIADKNHSDMEVLTIRQGYGTVPRNESGIDISFKDESKASYKKVEEGNFIIHLRSFQGGLEMANSDGIVSPAYTVLKHKIPINNRFFNEYFHTHKFIHRELAKAVEGIRDGRQISYRQFAVVNIPCPPLSEQNKIADYLTYIDNAIIAQEAKLDNMRAMKRGALQKIFSREWRFRDETGLKFPEWEEKRLGEVCKRFYSGQTPKSTNSSFYNGDIPWLSSGDLNRGIIYETEKKITEAGRKNANLKIMPVGTFIIAVFGLEADQVCGNCGILGIPSTVNQACMCIFPNEKYLSSKFLFQWYLHMGKIYGNKYCQGTKQQNYNLELLRQLDIVIPCLAEQQKIADYFLRLDKIIEAESTALDAMRKIKRGLLQRLFV